MKRNKYIIGLILSLGMASCSVEAPFEAPSSESTGELSKFALDFDVSLINSTRAENDDIIKNFYIEIYKEGSTSSPAYKALYKDMDDVIVLNAGKYKAYASYGENVVAEFESPYYKGESDEFEIEANKITTDIGTISCKLENVKVTINFHNSLSTVIDDDAYVEVHVNNEKGLKFYKNETKAGYFRHSDVCTLAATFNGKIDGVHLTEVKTLEDVQKGNHYSLTFSRHIYSEDSDEGEISGSIGVSAAVTIVNLNNNITIAEDEILDDKERPSEVDPSTGDEDNKGDQQPDDKDDPEDPDTPVYPDGPQASLDETSTVVLGKEAVNYINKDSKVILNIHSNAGIDTFTVEVESKTLDLAALGAEGGKLDMINPGGMLDTLHQLELLGPEENSLKGYHDVRFDISGFMELLTYLGEDTHLFIIKIGDADDEKEIYLNLTYKE